MNKVSAMPVETGVIDLEERSWLPRHSRGETEAFEQLMLAYRGFVMRD